MRRREFIRLLGLTAPSILAARAQEAPTLPRIGLLLVNSAADEEKVGTIGAFRDGLGRIGYVEGKTIVIERRFADGKLDRLPRLAAELVASKVDLIVTAGEGVYAAYRATKTVPIVGGTTGDLVATGLAESLAHPGGNVTGSMIFSSEIMAKRLELLKQMLPSLRRAGVLVNRNLEPRALQAVTFYLSAMAKSLAVELERIEASDAASYEAAFSSASALSIGGFVIQDSGQFFGDAEIIASAANRHGVATVGAPYFAESGMLLGYGVEGSDLWRRAAILVDKILRGAKPGDIPIERATRFHTIVNLKTAKALGIAIPPSVLAAADAVIE